MDLRGAILIDVSAQESVSFETEFLEGLGHPVLVCHGPPHAELCPILARASLGRACDKVEDAHGVIFELDLDRPQHRAILRRYREILPEDVPIRAVVREGQAEQYGDILVGVSVWEHSPTAADLDGFAAEVEAYDRLVP